jgi:hemoglobin
MTDGPDVTYRIEPGSITERVGIDTFFAIVDDFYARVEDDEVLRPVYPDDLEPGKTHLAQFLAQYFGATGLYSSHRGHPRLRMRHAPFTVTPDGAARWASHMSAAIPRAEPRRRQRGSAAGLRDPVRPADDQHLSRRPRRAAAAHDALTRPDGRS